VCAYQRVGVTLFDQLGQDPVLVGQRLGPIVAGYDALFRLLARQLFGQALEGHAPR
jgi:hypothetical protein